MAALLSASRLLVWRRCHVNVCRARILFTRKMLDTAEKAICMPEPVIDDYNLEIVGRVGDKPIRESLGEGSLRANPSECWHFVHRTRRKDDSATAGAVRTLSDVKIPIAGSNSPASTEQNHAQVQSSSVA